METTVEIAENETESSTLTLGMNSENPEPENTTAEQRPKSTKVAAEVQVLNSSYSYNSTINYCYFIFST